MLFKIFSLTTMMVLVMDPGGNLPVFVSLLKDKQPKEYFRIVTRESLAALGILGLFFIFGDRILSLLHVSKLSLELGGAIVLFLISLKMIFGTPIVPKDAQKKELFIVPLAVPLFAGPSAIAMTILLRSQAPAYLSVSALCLAWGISTAILLCGRFWARVLGQSLLNALESLVGFLLTLLSTEMFISSLRTMLK